MGSEDRTWDLVYSAVMDLAKAVSTLQEGVSTIGSQLREMREEVMDRFDHLERELVPIKARIFDLETARKTTR